MKLDFKSRVPVPDGTEISPPPAEPAEVSGHESSMTRGLPPVETSPKGSGLLRLFLGFALCFVFFYCLADYTSFTAGQIHPGELVFSNTMIQLWTATYRLAFIMGVVMAMIALVSAKGRGLWQFFKPTDEEPDFDLTYSIKHHLTPAQRVWLFYSVFFGFCFLFVLLLTVKLPESVSVTP